MSSDIPAVQKNTPLGLITPYHSSHQQQSYRISAIINIKAIPLLVSAYSVLPWYKATDIHVRCFVLRGMAFGIGSKSRNKEPLYFFYDCETTGTVPGEDQMVELACVIHTSGLKSMTRQELERSKSHEFSSLCYCEKELSPTAQRLTGLRQCDLRGQPQLGEVIMKLFVWIKDSITTTSKLEGREYVPVLVAHSGSQLDFPMLYLQVDSSAVLMEQLKTLHLHYVDTFSVFKDLKRSQLSYRRLESLSLQNIYITYFGAPYEGHRALADARALCKIFSDAPPAHDIHTFTKHTLTREDTEKRTEEIEKFREASIHPTKSIELLQRGITLDKLISEYKRSPVLFTSFLRNKCGITRPRPELMAYFNKH